MKSMKKIGAIFMAFVLAFSLCATAFAVDSTTYDAGCGEDGIVGTSDDMGKVTVSGIKDESDSLVVTVYPIFLAIYDANGNFAGYQSLYPSVVPSLDSLTKTENADGTVSYSFTEKQLEDIEKVLAASSADQIFADAKASVEAAGYSFGDFAAASYQMSTPTTTSEENGSSYTNDKVAIGSYLVHVTGAEAIEYNLAVVSSYYLNSNGNVVMDGTVNMIEEGNAWVKAEEPDVDKIITGTSTNPSDINDEQTGASVNVGDTVKYSVTVYDIPHYAGDYPIFNLTDTLSTGLTLNQNEAITVTVVDSTGATVATLVENTDYTLTTTDSSLSLNFVLAATEANPNGYTLNNYEGLNLVITYSVTVNGDAVYDADPNDNYVDLTYSVDSNVKNDEGHHDDKTYTYTFDIDGAGFPDGNSYNNSETWRVITKTGEEEYTGSVEGTNEYALAGAEFTLYTDYDCQTQYSNTVFNGTVTSDAQGQFAIKGLAAGTYYLKETKAPDGYALNNTVYKIVITTEYNDDGTLASWDIKTYACVNPSSADDSNWKLVGDSSFTVDYGDAVVPETSTDQDADFLNGYYKLTDPAYQFSGSNGTYTRTNAEGQTVTAVKQSSTADSAYWVVTTTETTYVDGEPVTTVVSEEYLDVAIATDGENVSYTVTKVDADVNEVEIANTTTPELPNTGGIGTTLFYIIGALIIVAAVVLFVTMRRRNNRRTAE